MTARARDGHVQAAPLAGRQSFDVQARWEAQFFAFLPSSLEGAGSDGQFLLAAAATLGGCGGHACGICQEAGGGTNLIAARYLWVRELVIRRSGIKWAQSLPCRPQTS